MLISTSLGSGCYGYGVSCCIVTNVTALHATMQMGDQSATTRSNRRCASENVKLLRKKLILKYCFTVFGLGELHLTVVC
jgi:hypothetical protein